MLTYTELRELERTSRSTRILSVYLPAAASDPADRDMWRTELGNRLASLRDGLASGRDPDRAELERACDFARAHLEGLTLPSSGGHAVFASGDAVLHAAALPARTPPLVSWGEGVRIAPYLRALKQLTPVIVVLADSRKARLFRYRDASLEQLDTIRANVQLEAPAHMGDAPRPGFKPNTRGRTAADGAQRELQVATSRMVVETSRRISDLAGDDGWVICGGTGKVSAALLDALPARLGWRTLVAPRLHTRSTMASIAEQADTGAATLRRRRDLRAVEELLDRSGAQGQGASGINETLRALAAGAVGELFVTPSFLRTFPDEAEAACRAAMDQRAMIEVVSGFAAERLDQATGGIGALLRFVAFATPPIRPGREEVAVP